MKEIENADGQAPATEQPQEASLISELSTTSKIVDDSDTNHLT